MGLGAVEAATARDTEFGLRGGDGAAHCAANKRPPPHLELRAPSELLPKELDDDADTHEGHSSWPVATMHIFTAVVGAGVLALPSALSWLGWVFGIPAIVLFFVITLWMSYLLADIYESGGKRHPRYLDAVNSILGPRHAAVLVTAQMLTCALGGLGLMIAGAGAMATVGGYACTYAGAATCYNKQWLMVVIFGALQLPLSQLPNLESIWAVSVMGAACSIGYSVIAVALGASSVKGLGSLWGRAAAPFEKAMGVFGALGDISVAYYCAVIILEVQDTLRERAPGDAARGMKKALTASLGTAAALFLAVASTNYSALGDAVPDSVLDAGYPHAPDWVPLVANVMIALHMVSAFQVYMQPLFSNAEAVARKLLRCCATLAAGAAERGGDLQCGSATDGPPAARHRASGLSVVSRGLSSFSVAVAPKRALSNSFSNLPAGVAPPSARRRAAARLALRLVVRSALVAIAMVLAVLVPSFSSVIGLIGALLFWPAGVFYPTLLYTKVHRPGAGFRRAMAGLNVVMGFVSLAATIGSVYGIAMAARGFRR